MTLCASESEPIPVGNRAHLGKLEGVVAPEDVFARHWADTIAG